MKSSAQFLFVVTLPFALLSGLLPPVEAGTSEEDFYTDQYGRISGAAKFVFIDETTGFSTPGPNASDCGASIVGATGEPPLQSFPAAYSLSAGTAAHIASILPENGFETTIAVQNVGAEPSVIKIFYFDDREDFVGSGCAYLWPGATHTFAPDSIPLRARVATVLSLSTEATSGAMDIYDICELVVLPNDKGGADEKGPTFFWGSPIVAQVQRRRVDQATGQPIASTMYNAQSDRMGDADREGDRDRYILPRIVTSASADTQIYLYNTYAAPTIAGVTFHNEAGGATVFREVYLTGYDQDTLSAREIFDTSGVFQTGFQGWAIVENYPGAEAPLAIVADLVHQDGQAIASYTPSFLESGNFNFFGGDSLAAPVFYQPGWKTRVAVNNVSDSNSATLSVQRHDALHNLIDSDVGMVGPEEVATFEFPDPAFGPVPVAGTVRVNADQEIQGVIELYREDDRGNVLETVVYNLHNEAETIDRFSFGSLKGFTRQGGASRLALPLAGKLDPSNGRETEILLTNLNQNPGLTAASIYLYDGAGLRDLQCVVMQPNETLRIPVDFPRLGEGAVAALLIEGTTTSQAIEDAGSLREMYALAAVAYQRTTPPQAPPDSSVDLAPGGNDAASAYVGSIGGLASGLLFFPALRAAAGSEGASVRMTLQGTENPFVTPSTVAGVVLFNATGVAGTILTSTIENLVPYTIDDVSFPLDAIAATVLSLDSSSASTTVSFQAIQTLEDYARFLHGLAGGLKAAKATPAYAAGMLLRGVVHRDAPSPDGAGNRVFCAYEGAIGGFLGSFDFRYGGISYCAPYVSTKNGFNTALYIQNAGSFPTSLDLTFVEGVSPQSSPKVKVSPEFNEIDFKLGPKAFGEKPHKVVHIESLQPGLTGLIRPADYVGAGFEGSVLVRAARPLVIVTDIFSGGSLSSHTGRPSEIERRSPVQEGDDDDDVLNKSEEEKDLLPAFSVGSTQTIAPLIYSPDEGWETNLHIQNMSNIVDVKVRIDFHDASGQVVETHTGFIPPAAVATFTREARTIAPDAEPQTIGWARIVTEEYWENGSLPVGATRILGVVRLLKRNANGCVLESVAYNTLSENEVFSQGFFKFLSAADTLLTFPEILRDAGTFNIGTDIAYANVNIETGQTEIVETRALGNGFSSSFASSTIGSREGVLLKSSEQVGFPVDVPFSFTLNLTPPGEVQPGGIAVAGVAVQRAYALLPNAECAALDSPTPTQSPTETATSSQESTSSPTPTSPGNETATPTPTSTSTSTGGGGNTPTPTETSSGGPDPELLRADINQDGKVDALDQLILMKWWQFTYELP